MTVRWVGLAEEETMKQRRFAVVVLVVACALTATAAITQAKMNATLEATGVIYVEQIRVASELQGQVVHVLVKTGDVVRMGDPLVVLQSKAVEASVDQAHSELETAKARLEGSAANRIARKPRLSRRRNASRA